MDTSKSVKTPFMSYTRSFILISFLGAFLNVASADSGFCVYHFPDWDSGASIDEYVFYAYTTEVTNSSYYDPDPSLLESEVCRIAPVSLDQEIGAGSLIAPSMVNACESTCDQLLSDVRSRISRAGCTHNAELSREYACDYARDRRILRPPRPANTGTGSTGSSPPAGPGDGDNGPGSSGSTGGPGSTGGSESTLPPGSAFGPNNSTSLACESGPGSSFPSGDNFCRPICGDLVEQALLRLQPGVRPISTSFGNLVALWSYAEAWNNCP